MPLIRRLVIVANVQWPKFGAAAGGAVHTLEVARRLNERCEVSVVVPDFLERELRTSFPDIKLALTPSLRKITKATLPTLAFSCVSWLRRFRMMRNADALLCASHMFGDVLPLLFIPNVRGAVIVHHLVEPPWRRPGSPVFNAIHYFSSRASLAVAAYRANSIVTLSEQVAIQLRSMGICLPIVVTVNAPSTFSHPPPPASSRVEGRVVFVGHVAPPKGVESLLEAWHSVAMRRPKATLHIIGGGDAAFVSSLVQKAERLGISDSVSFLGRVDEGMKERELFEASVFAFPSFEEGFGIALVEAMSARIPCVTYDLPIFRELFCKGRVSVPIGAVMRFADAIIQLLEDDERRVAMADEGFLESQRFTWERAAALDWHALEIATR